LSTELNGYKQVKNCTSSKLQTHKPTGPQCTFLPYGDIAVPLISCSHAGLSLLYIRLCLVVTRNILSECLMLRDNLLFLSVDFSRQDIVDLVSHLCVA